MDIIDIGQEITRIVADHSGKKREDIQGYTNLSSDLSLDSLDKIEIIMEIEEVFNLEIPDDEAEKCYNVGDAINLVRSKLHRWKIDKI